jgi:hypothetical protein
MALQQQAQNILLRVGVDDILPLIPNRLSQGYYEWVRQRAQAIEEQRKPQPVKTVWARGSMEWQAEQEADSG